MIDNTAKDYESVRLMAHKEDAMKIYAKVFRHEYLPTFEKQLENDQEIEKALK